MSAVYGIVGERTHAAEADRDFAAMGTALHARGPDRHATHVDRVEAIMLGFRFLRTSPAEADPAVLTNADRSLLMVCDGHVLNHDELGARFGRHPHSCQLLLRLYETEGVEGWRRVDGQFALALWDRRSRRLVLARDFLGVRSLYYSSDRRGVAFASEIKSILHLSHGRPAIDETALSDFLTFTSVPGPRTLFAGIRRVPAGAAVICDPEGHLETRPFWDLLDDPIAESDDERFYVDGLRSLHRQSVERRDIEGPVAALLSGGNDSSANAALLAAKSSGRVHTFTVGLGAVEGSDRYSDIEYARRVSALIGSQHHERLLTVDEFLQTIPVTIDALDDLVAEPSAVFLHHALRMAAEQGLRVVITGEANDELCCGHGGMVHVRGGYYGRWLPLMRRPLWLRRALAVVGPLISPRRRDILRRAAAGEEYFWSYETAWMDSDKHDVLTERPTDPGIGKASRIVEARRQRFDRSEHGRRDYLAYIIYAMMQDFYFGNLMLGKLDALASPLSVEPRCPYTAPAYAHFAYNIPAHIKTKNGLVKYVFKKAIEGLLPEGIIYRPKQGFRTPVVELFQGSLGKWAEPILLETGLTRAGLLNRDHLRRLLTRHRQGQNDYANRLWTAMCVNLWYERWIATPPAALPQAIVAPGLPGVGAGL